MNRPIHDAFQAVQASPELKERTRAYLHARRTSARPRYRSLLAAAACLVLVFLGTGGALAWFTPVSAVSVEAGTSLELTLNRFDRVLEVQGDSIQDQELADRLKLVYLSYTDALETILASQEVSQALDGGAELAVTVAGQNEQHCQDLMEDTQSCAGHGTCSSADWSQVTAAQQSGLSLSKYQMLLQLQALDPSITAQQVAELFILIGLGALGAKTGLLRPEGKQTLSNLLVNLVVPAMIINSYRMEFSAEILHNLMAAFALSTLSILLGLIITLLFTARSRDSRTPIFRFACVFSNAGYMGLPLISALFGSEGLLYASAFFTMFNLLLWTVGYSMVSGSSDPKKVAQSLLHCPAIYAIVVGLAIYLLQIPLPDLIVQPMELLGNMNTPLSMLITGMLIASGDLHRTLTDQHIWKLTVVRMLFIPMLTIAAFAALGLFRYGMVTQVIVLLECCPAASITSVFAVQFHHDEQFAAGSVVLTTLLSIVFLPLCALIITMF